MMTLVIYVFVATTLANPAPTAFKFATAALCQQVRAALDASGQVLAASGCVPLVVEVSVE